MNENLILNFREVLMHEGITRTINGSLDSEPPWLGASVRKELIERGAYEQHERQKSGGDSEFYFLELDVEL